MLGVASLGFDSLFKVDFPLGATGVTKSFYALVAFFIRYEHGPMTHIRNPILPGFKPDPSICRVDDDFYIATSTFEWFPGVQIHHSRDLVHWNLITHALNEKRLLDLSGVPSSGGIWAPALSFCDGLFFYKTFNTNQTDIWLNRWTG